MNLVIVFCTLASAWVVAQENRLRAWQPGLPEDGVVMVSRIGQGKATRQLFNDCWAAFREQYYVDSDGAFRPHSITVEALRTVGNLNYSAYIKSQERLEQHNPYRRKLEIIGNADGAGRPIDGFYMVRPYQHSVEQEVGDRRFPTANDARPVGWKLFVSDSSAVRSGVVEIMAERVSGGEYRELATLPDTKKLQDSFIESLKVGSVFKVIIRRHVACPYGTWVANERCEVCKGQGGREFPHLMTLKW